MLTGPKSRWRFACAALALGFLTVQDTTTSAQAVQAVTRERANDLQAADKQPAPGYVIGPEDVLSVFFWREEEMSGDVIVRPDGMITLPLVGSLQAAGLSPERLRDEIHVAASKYLTDVHVTVSVSQINSRKVFITGQVAAPGAYPLIGPLTVMQLIALAGGLNEFADKGGVTVMREVDGRTVRHRFNYQWVAEGKNLDQNINLQPGDTVVVP